MDPDSSILTDLSSLTDFSSELSSVGSRSPDLVSRSPDLGYPSPLSSQDLDSIDRYAIDNPKKHQLGDDDNAPVTKKRKRPEPKPRTTQRLDLTVDPDSLATEQKTQLDLLLKVLRKRRKIVVIAGAGISVSAGIPDFRSSTGLFKSLKSDHKLKASGKQLFDASVYQTDSSTSSFHDMVRSLSGLVKDAKPTAFHQMLSTLGSEGRLLRLYTQNVDGIDVALPSLETSVPLGQKGPWPRSVQLHGGLEKMVCSKCRNLSDFEPLLFNGPEPPLCEACIEADRVRTDHAGKRSHGIGRLRPRIVLYNEHNPDEEAIGAVVGADLKTRPDAIIVVGTSMKIPGVKRIVREMCGVVRSRRDGVAIWLNQDGPPPGKEFEDCWDLIVKGPCDEVARQWNMSVNAHVECTSSDVERAKEGLKVEVVVTSTPQKPKATVEMMTPAPSPRPKMKTVINLIVPPKATITDNEATNAAASSKKKNAMPEKPKKRAVKSQAKPKSSTAKTAKKRETGAGAIEQQFKLTKPRLYTGRPRKSSKTPPPLASSTASHRPNAIDDLSKNIPTAPPLLAPISEPAARNTDNKPHLPPLGLGHPPKSSPFSSTHSADNYPTSGSTQYPGSTTAEVRIEQHGPPQTPPMASKDERGSLSPGMMRETISPKSKPNQMTFLID